MAVLCQLADPRGYRPFDWSLTADPEDFAYWIGLFTSFPGNIEQRLREDGILNDGAAERWPMFREEYLARFSELRDHPERFDEITTFTLCHLRQEMLDKYDFEDPYLGVKRRENAIAAGLYPALIAEIDALPPVVRWDTLLRSVFAGNMFDLGCPHTIEMYNAGKIDFHDILDRIPTRPWRIDHADEIVRRLEAGYRQVLLFVDNAGTDIVLGVVPLAREIARRGTRVVLAANTRPALNDITLDELNPLLDRLANDDATLDGLLCDGRIATVPSGCGAPLIDLSRVSTECDAAAAESDLLVLEGMGRGVESNWRQAFKCDVWRVALLKDECVAKWLGAKLFEPICRFASAEA
jgi:type II pantothenate kinase